MKSALILVICLSIFGLSFTKQISKYIAPRADAINVGIYYESHNDNTINLIKNNLQLSDAFLNIVNFDLVPWGQTTYDSSSNTFTCTGGLNECLADRIHACAITLSPNQMKQVLQFVTCTVQRDDWKNNPAESANVCANQVDGWVDMFPRIETCAHMNDSDDVNIFLAMRDKTLALNPKLDHVPWVTVGGNNNTDAESNLIKVICDNYNGDKPPECGSGTAVNVGIYYESHNDNTINLIKNNLQLSDAFLNIVNFDLVPWGQTTYDSSSNKFTCTGGDNECFADRIHACAITLSPNQMKQVLQFVTCTVQRYNWKNDSAEAANVCANQVDGWVDMFPRIETCAHMNDTEDINIFLAMRDKTLALNPKLDHVPWVTVGGNNNTDAESDLIKVICDNYNGLKPNECYATGSTTIDTGSTTQPPGGASQMIISNKLLSLIIVFIAIIVSIK